MPAAPRALPPPLHPHRAQLVATAIETALADRAWSIRRLDGEPCFRCFLLRRGEGAYLGGATAPLELGAPQLVWLPFSAAGEFRLNAGAEGAAVLVSEDMVFRTLAENPLAAELRPLIDRALIAPSAEVAANLDEIEALFAALARESKTPGPGALAMSALYLGLVMMHLGRACGLGREESDALSAGAPTAQRFRQLVELHYRDNLSIDDFSRLLGVARGSLHGACLRARWAARRSRSSMNASRPRRGSG